MIGKNFKRKTMQGHDIAAVFYNSLREFFSAIMLGYPHLSFDTPPQNNTRVFFEIGKVSYPS